MTTGDCRNTRKEGWSEKAGGTTNKEEEKIQRHGLKVKLTTLTRRVRQHMWHSPAHRTQTRLSSHPQSQPWHGNPLRSPLWRSPAPATQKRDKGLYHVSSDSFQLIPLWFISSVRMSNPLTATAALSLCIWIFNYFIISIVQPCFSSLLQMSEIFLVRFHQGQTGAVFLLPWSSKLRLKGSRSGWSSQPTLDAARVEYKRSSDMKLTAGLVFECRV